MELVERTDQTDRLERLLSLAADRQGQTVVLDGPAASGRTALLQHTAEQAARRGFLVLHATCAAAESGLQLGAITQLLHSAELPEDAAQQGVRLLHEAAAQREGGAPAPAPGQPQALHELCLLLFKIAAEAPTLIAVDDVQHADADSLQCLLALARRLRSAHGLLVLTDDAHRPARAVSFRPELRRLPNYHAIGVENLSTAGVARLLAPIVGTASAERLGPEFHAASGGNLVLLRALIDDHLASGGIRPLGYGQAVLDLLARADPAVAPIARALAVLGPQTDLAEVGALTGSPDCAQPATRILNAVGIVDGVAFRHGVGRAAVLDDLPRDRRSDLYLAGARILHQRDAPATRVGRLLVAADRAPDAWAPDTLREAAECELLAHGDRAATALLDLAHRSSPPGPRRAAAQTQLLQVEWRSDPATAARHLGPLTEALHAGHLPRADHGTLLRQLLWHGRTREARGVLDRMRGELPDQDREANAELRDIEHWIAWTHPRLAQRRRPRSAPGCEAGALTPERGPWLQSAAALADAMLRATADQATEHASRVLHDLKTFEVTPWAEEAALLALSALNTAGHCDDAAAWSLDLLTADGPPRSPTLRALAAVAAAQSALRLGELNTAVNQARMAMTHISQKSWGLAAGLPLGTLILAATRAGRYDEAARQLAQSVPEAMFDSRYGLYYVFARGYYYLATNHTHAALADFLSCGELTGAWGLDVPGVVPWRIGASEAWLRLGNGDQARKLLYEQLARPGSTSSNTRGMALRLLAAAGPATRRLQLLDEALELLEECGNRYVQAQVLANSVQAYQALGDSRRARIQSRRARHLAQQCEALPLCQELLAASSDLAEPGRPGVDAEAPSAVALTASERRVATLAVRGYTNREIAVKLFITPSTVEQHLTRVYRKHGVKQRKDLPVSLGVLTAGSPGQGSKDGWDRKHLS